MARVYPPARRGVWVGASVPPETLLSSPLAIGPHERVERDYWGNAVAEHKKLGAIRGFIREYSDVRGSSRLFNSCLQYFYRYTLEGANREEFRPVCCRGRAVCPHCAVTYGLERGLEVSSLFRALFEPDKLFGSTPTVKAFAEVFTLPDWVSEVLDGYVQWALIESPSLHEKGIGLRAKNNSLSLCLEQCSSPLSRWFRNKRRYRRAQALLKRNEKRLREHKRQLADLRRPLRKAVEQLTEAVKITLVALYGSDVGAKVNWHWWHSSDPLKGPHWHAHVMVPNIAMADDGAASVVQSRGVLTPDRLLKLKTLWADAVFSCKFVREFGQESLPELVVDHRFLTRNRGKNSIAHRARYDYRHPMQDFVAFVDKCGLPSMTDERVEWFLSRCEFLQGVQLVRSIGWLSNPKIKKIGLKRVEPELDNWTKDAINTYQLVRFDDQGAWFSVFDTLMQVSKGIKHVHRSFLKLGGRPELRRYVWVV